MGVLGLFRLGRDRLGGPGRHDGGVARGRPVTLEDVISRRRPAQWSARLWVFDAETGAETEVPCGAFTLDIQADDWPRRSLSATLAGPTDEVLAALRAPRGTLRASVGIREPDSGQSWVAQIGAFHPRLDLSHDAEGGVQVDIRADDVSARVRRAALRSRIITTKGPLEQVVQQILASAQSDLTVTSGPTGVELDRIVLQSSRGPFWRQIAGVAFAKGYDLLVDQTGGVRLQRLPDAAGEPLVTWDTGDSVVASLSTGTGEGLLSGVSVIGALGELWVYPDGAYGLIEEATGIDSSQIRTKAEAMDAGRARMQQMIAASHPGVSLTVPMDPWRDVNDVVRVIDRDLDVSYLGRVTKISWSASDGKIDPTMTVQVNNVAVENPDPDAGKETR